MMGKEYRNGTVIAYLGDAALQLTVEFAAWVTNLRLNELLPSHRC